MGAKIHDKLWDKEWDKTIWIINAKYCAKAAVFAENVNGFPNFIHTYFSIEFCPTT